MAERNLRYLVRLTIVPAIALALMASGCLWGVVKDAETGAGLPGMTVAYTDQNGATGTTTTDASGIYAFDQADGPVPAAGPVSFEVSGPGYEPMTAARLVQYNDSNGSLSNLSTFWEVQSFNLTPHLVQRVQFSVSSVDVDVAELALPGSTPINDSYAVILRLYDPDDLSTVLCEDASPTTVIAVTDPAPQTLDLGCQIPGDAFRAVVGVVLQRLYDPIGPLPPVSDAVVSTASFDWIAPEPNTDWESDTLHGSSDPRLVFDANVRYRAINGPEVAPIHVSDRNLKDNFAAVDGRVVLARLAGIPILTWNYKADSALVRHMGPMAQDFYGAFGLGDTDKAIFSVDAQGVLFVAVQALYEMALEKDAEIAALQQQVADLSARLAALEKRLGTQ